MKHVLSFTLALCLSMPAVAAPSSQLVQSVANRLQFYGISVDPETLTTQQAAALHTFMSSNRNYLEVRRRARTILSSPEFRD